MKSFSLMFALVVTLIGGAFSYTVSAAGILVQKVTLPSDAIDTDPATPQPFVQTFAFSLTGPGLGTAGQVSFELGDGDIWSPLDAGYLAVAGTYSLVETQPVGHELVFGPEDSAPINLGWSSDSVLCVNQNGAQLDAVAMRLEADDTVICTVTSRLSGALVVDSQTDPAGVADVFDFAVVGTDGFSESFGLQDAELPWRHEFNAGSGPFEITLDALPGWVGDITCSNGDPAGAVQIGAGELVNCVSSVRQVDPTRIRVTKQCQNSDNGERFEITLFEDGEFVESRDLGCTNTTMFTVDPGRQYSIVESDTEGWVQITGNCNWPAGLTTAAIPHSPRPHAITDCVMVNEWAVVGLRITKTALTPSIYAGDDARFQISVINTGNTPLTDVNVTDMLAPDCERQLAQLAARDTFQYECELPLVKKSFVNVAVVNTKEGVSGSDDAPVEVVNITAKPTPSNRITLRFATVSEDPSAVLRLRFGDATINRDFRHGDTWTSGLLGEYTLVIGAADLPQGATATVLCDNGDQGSGTAGVTMGSNETIECTLSYTFP